MNWKNLFCLSLLSLILCSCGGGQRYTQRYDSAPLTQPENLITTPDAIPTDEPRSRGGNPTSYTVFGKKYYVSRESKNFQQQGMASWYGEKFHGHKTSNGEVYNMYAMSAAHKTLPIPTYLEVTNLRNSKKVIVRVNDRGPFHGNRIIDLSYVAAAKLDMLGQGTAHVKIRALDTQRLTSQTGQTVAIAGIPPQTDGKSLYIQVGAFGDHTNAIRLKEKLDAEGISSPHINHKQRLSTNLFIVQSGPYQSIKDAELDHQKIQTIGISNSHYIYP